MRTQVRARIRCPHGRHSTWRSQDRRAATHNVSAQHRRSSSIKTVALATSITQKLHAFAHLFPLASMHLANPPTTLLQRSAVLRQRHFACSPCLSCLSDVSYQDAYAGMRFMGFTGREVFFSMLQPMFAPTALAQIWRVFGHGHENLLI